MGGEQHLRVVLVHRHRRGEDTRPDVADPGHLEEPLDRAVLAPRPVQQRENDIHLTELRAASPPAPRHEVATPGIALSATALAVGVDLRDMARGQRQPLRLVGLEHPLAVDADPDGDDVVRVLVDHREDAGGRGARDRVLARATTEDDSDAGLSVRAHCRSA